MVDKIIKTYGIIAKILAILSAAFICVMMMVTVVDIIMRTFLNDSLTGGTEIISMTMVCVVYFAVGYTTFQRGMITVDIIKVPFVVVMIANALSIITSIALMIALLQQAYVAFTTGGGTLRLQIPNWPFMYITAFGFAMMVLSIVVLMIWDVRNKRVGIDIGKVSESDLEEGLKAKRKAEKEKAEIEEMNMEVNSK